MQLGGGLRVRALLRLEIGPTSFTIFLLPVVSPELLELCPLLFHLHFPDEVVGSLKVCVLLVDFLKQGRVINMRGFYNGVSLGFLGLIACLQFRYVLGNFLFLLDIYRNANRSRDYWIRFCRSRTGDIRLGKHQTVAQSRRNAETRCFRKFFEGGETLLRRFTVKFWVVILGFVNSGGALV